MKNAPRVKIDPTDPTARLTKIDLKSVAINAPAGTRVVLADGRAGTLTSRANNPGMNSREVALDEGGTTEWAPGWGAAYNPDDLARYVTPVTPVTPAVTPPTAAAPVVAPVVAPKAEAPAPLKPRDFVDRFPNGFPSVAELTKMAENLGIDSIVNVKRGSPEAVAKAKAAGESTADESIQVQLMERIIQAERAGAVANPAPSPTAPDAPTADAAPAAAPSAQPPAAPEQPKSQEAAQFEQDVNDLNDLLGGSDTINAGETPSAQAEGQPQADRPKSGLDLDNAEHLAKLNRVAKTLAANGNKTPESFAEATLAVFNKNASKVDGGLLNTMWAAARRADPTLPKSSEDAFDQLLFNRNQQPKTNEPTSQPPTPPPAASNQPGGSPAPKGEEPKLPAQQEPEVPAAPVAGAAAADPHEGLKKQIEAAKKKYASLLAHPKNNGFVEVTDPKEASNGLATKVATGKIAIHLDKLAEMLSRTKDWGMDPNRALDKTIEEEAVHVVQGEIHNNAPSHYDTLYAHIDAQDMADFVEVYGSKAAKSMDPWVLAVEYERALWQFAQDGTIAEETRSKKPEMIEAIERLKAKWEAGNQSDEVKASVARLDNYISNPAAGIPAATAPKPAPPVAPVPPVTPPSAPKPKSIIPVIGDTKIKKQHWVKDRELAEARGTQQYDGNDATFMLSDGTIVSGHWAVVDGRLLANFPGNQRPPAEHKATVEYIADVAKDFIPENVLTPKLQLEKGSILATNSSFNGLGSSVVIISSNPQTPEEQWYVILGGHRREYIIQQHASEYSQKLPKFLAKYREEYGISPELAAGVPHARLVLLVDTPLDNNQQQVAVNDLNQTGQQPAEASHEAVAAGGRMSQASINAAGMLFESGIHATDSTKDKTSAAMLQEAGAKDLSDAMLADTSINQKDKKLFIAENHSFTKEGVIYVTRALVGRIVGSGEIVDKMTDQMEAKLLNGLIPLFRIISRLPENSDFRKNFTDAISEEVARASTKYKGGIPTVEDFQRLRKQELGMFESVDPNIAVLQRWLATFDSRNAKKAFNALLDKFLPFDDWNDVNLDGTANQDISRGLLDMEGAGKDIKLHGKDIKLHAGETPEVPGLFDANPEKENQKFLKEWKALKTLEAKGKATRIDFDRITEIETALGQQFIPGALEAPREEMEANTPANKIRHDLIRLSKFRGGDPVLDEVVERLRLGAYKEAVRTLRMKGYNPEADIIEVMLLNKRKPIAKTTTDDLFEPAPPKLTQDTLFAGRTPKRKDTGTIDLLPPEPAKRKLKFTWTPDPAVSGKIVTPTRIGSLSITFIPNAVYELRTHLANGGKAKKVGDFTTLEAAQDYVEARMGGLLIKPDSTETVTRNPSTRLVGPSQKAQQFNLHFKTGRTVPTGQKARKLIENRAMSAAAARRQLKVDYVPTGIAQILKPHQKMGANMALDAFQRGQNFLNADGTGAGKTMQQLTVAAARAMPPQFRWQEWTEHDFLAKMEARYGERWKDLMTPREKAFVDAINIKEPIFYSADYNLWAVRKNAKDSGSKYSVINFDISQSAVQPMTKVGSIDTMDEAKEMAQSIGEEYVKNGDVKGDTVLIMTKNSNLIETAFAKDAEMLGLTSDDSPVQVYRYNGDEPVPGRIYLATHTDAQRGLIKPGAFKTVIIDEAHAGRNEVLKPNETSLGVTMDNVAKTAEHVMYATATPTDKPAHLWFFRSVFARDVGAVFAEMGMEMSPSVNKETGKTVMDVKFTRRMTHAERDALQEKLFNELTRSGLMIQREVPLDNTVIKFKEVQISDEDYIYADDLYDRIKRAEEQKKNFKYSIGIASNVVRAHLEIAKVASVMDMVAEAVRANRQVIVYADRIADGKTGTYSEGIDGTIKTLVEKLEAKYGKGTIGQLFGSDNGRKVRDVNRFQDGEIKILIATAQSGGTGLSLDDIYGDSPRTLIMMTPPYSALEFVQMCGRINRLTTLSKGEVYAIFSEHPLDTWGMDITARKLSTLGATVTGDILNIKPIEERDRELNRGDMVNYVMETNMPIWDGTEMVVPETEREARAILENPNSASQAQRSIFEAQAFQNRERLNTTGGKELTEQEILNFANSPTAFSALSGGHASLQKALQNFESDGALFPEHSAVIRAVTSQSSDALLRRIAFGSLAKKAKYLGLGGGSFGGTGTLQLRKEGTSANRNKTGGVERIADLDMAAVFFHELGHVAYFVLLTAKERRYVGRVYAKLGKAGTEEHFTKSLGEGGPRQEARSQERGGNPAYYSKNVYEFFAQSFAEYVIGHKMPPLVINGIYKGVLGWINNYTLGIRRKGGDPKLEAIYNFGLQLDKKAANLNFGTEVKQQMMTVPPLAEGDIYYKQGTDKLWRMFATTNNAPLGNGTFANEEEAKASARRLAKTPGGLVRYYLNKPTRFVAADLERYGAPGTPLNELPQRGSEWFASHFDGRNFRFSFAARSRNASGQLDPAKEYTSTVYKTGKEWTFAVTDEEGDPVQTMSFKTWKEATDVATGWIDKSQKNIERLDQIEIRTGAKWELLDVVIGTDEFKDSVQADVLLNAGETPEAPGETKQLKGADMARMVSVLGESMYAKQLWHTIGKEVFQNAFDAVQKSSGSPKIIWSTGNMFTSSENKFAIADNGPGMTPEQIVEKFLPAFVSGKGVGEGGGFGMAKLAFLGGSKEWKLITVAKDGQGRLVKTHLEGSGLAYLEFVTNPPSIRMNIGDKIKLADGLTMISQYVQPNSKETTGTALEFLSTKSAYDAENFIYRARPFTPNVEIWPTNGFIPAEDLQEQLAKGPEYPQQVDAWSPLHTIDLPEATVELIAKDGSVESVSAYVRLSILNRSILQFEDTIYLKSPVLLPTVALNIKPKVEAGTVDYPFSTNRESITKKISDEVKKYLKNLGDKAIAEMNLKYENLKNNAPTIAGTTLQLFNAAANVPTELINRITNAPEAADIALDIERIQTAILKMLHRRLGDKYGRAKFAGLITGGNAYGVHLGKKDGPSQIYHDPWLTYKYANEEANEIMVRNAEALGWAEEQALYYDAFLAKTAGVALHEALHQDIHDEGEELARGLTFNAGDIVDTVVSLIKTDRTNEQTNRLNTFLYETGRELSAYADAQETNRVFVAQGGYQGYSFGKQRQDGGGAESNRQDGPIENSAAPDPITTADDEIRGDTLNAGETPEPPKEDNLEGPDPKVQISSKPTAYYKGKPIGKQEAVEAFAKVLQAAGKTVPIRTGRIGKRKVAGVFKRDPEVIRLRTALSVGTAAHEMGHGLMKVIYEHAKTTSLNTLTSAVRLELTALGRAAYPTQKPPGGSYVYEGFGEYVRKFMTEDGTQAAYPATSKYLLTDVLPTVPKVDAAFRRAKEIVDQFRAQGQVNALQGNVKDTSKLSFRVKKVVSKLTADEMIRNWVEEFQPIRTLVMEAEVKLEDQLSRMTPADATTLRKKLVGTYEYGKLKPSVDPFHIASVRRGTSGHIASYMVNTQMIDFAGNAVGSSLKTALEPVRDDMPSFTIYALAHRAMDRWGYVIDPRSGNWVRDPDRRAKDPGIPLEQARSVIKELKTDERDKAIQGLRDWNNQLLDYVAQSSPAMAKALSKIREKSDFYLPLARFFTDDEVKTGSYEPGQTNALYRMVGSGRSIMEPFPVLLQNAQRLISLAHKEQVVSAILNLRSIEGLGYRIEEVPRSFVKQYVTVNKVAEQLEDLGLDLSNVDKDTLLEYFTPAMKPSGSDPIVAHIEDGVTKWFFVDPRIYDVIQGIDLYRLPNTMATLFVDTLFGKPARLFRLGTTGLRASFSLFTNPARDFATFLIQSKESNPAKLLAAWAGGLLSAVRAPEVLSAITRGTAGSALAVQSKMWKDAFDRMAVQISQPLGDDIAQSANAYREMHYGMVQRIVHHPIDALRELFSVTESAPRLAELKLVASQVGWDGTSPVTMDQMLMMALAAKRVTTDFSAVGAIGKKVNQVIPFFNATIQGGRGFARALKENPLKAILMAIATLTIPALLLWWKNKDEDWYKDMPWRRKYLYFNIPYDNLLLQIPKPQDWGNFFTVIPEAIMDMWYRKDPEAAKQAWEHMSATMNPVSLPPLINAIYENAANKTSFFDRPIVPRSEVDLPPGDQRSPYTSDLAKFLGDTFPNTVSPRKLDAAVKATTGGAIGDFHRDIETIGKALGFIDGQRELEPSDIPVIGRAFARGGTDGAASIAVDKFYDEYEKANARTRSVLMPETPVDRVRRLMLNDAASAIKVLTASRSFASTMEQQQTINRRIRQIATEAAQLSPPASVPEKKTYDESKATPRVQPKGKVSRPKLWPEAKQKSSREMTSFY